MTSESKYSELKAAAMAATDGPWESIYDDWSDGDDALISCESRDGMVAIAKIEGGGSESSFDGSFKTEQQANTRYIAAANPAVVLALLAELESKDKRIAELERSETQLIEERDVAHDAIDAMYAAATGERPEWSNWFGFADAVEEVAQVCTKLATPVRLPTQEINDDPLSAHLAINDSADGIRAAGFKVERMNSESDRP